MVVGEKEGDSGNMIGEGGHSYSQFQKDCSTATATGLGQASLSKQSKTSQGQALVSPATAQAGELHDLVRLIF